MPTFDFKALNQKKEEFKIVLESKTIILPKVFPADIVLDMEAEELEILEEARLAKERGEEVDVSDEKADTLGFGLIEKIFGEEDWRLVLREIGIENVPMLVDEVLAYYGMGGKDKGPKAKETEEETTEEASPSQIVSENGHSSTQTSSDTGQSSDENTTQESSTSNDSSSDSLPFRPTASS